MQLAFVVVKRSPVHLKAAAGVCPVKILNFVCWLGHTFKIFSHNCPFWVRKHNKVMTNTKVGPIFLLGLFYLLGRFSIDDGDGSENFQKINSRFITKNNNFARASRFLLHFFVVTARLRREKMCENLNCTFYGGRKQATTNFSFSF